MTEIRNGLRWTVTARRTSDALAEVHGYGDTPEEALEHLRRVTKALWVYASVEACSEQTVDQE